MIRADTVYTRVLQTLTYRPETLLGSRLFGDTVIGVMYLYQQLQRFSEAVYSPDCHSNSHGFMVYSNLAYIRLYFMWCETDE